MNSLIISVRFFARLKILFGLLVFNFPLGLCDVLGLKTLTLGLFDLKRIDDFGELLGLVTNPFLLNEVYLGLFLGILKRPYKRSLVI